MKVFAAAIVMAGGRSSRMGRDKSLLKIDDSSLLERICRQLNPLFEEILISGGDEKRLSFLNRKIIPDRTAGRGPLMGIVSAVSASSFDLNMIVACDIPDLDLELIEQMMDRGETWDAVIPRNADGSIEPLFGVYNKSILPEMERVLAAGENKIDAAFINARVRYVELSPEQAIKNINTRDDLQSYIRSREG